MRQYFVRDFTQNEFFGGKGSSRASLFHDPSVVLGVESGHFSWQSHVPWLANH